MKLMATALACLAVACGSALAAGSPVGFDAPPSVAEFAISYERNGGLAPDPRSLEIKPGGHATAKRRKLPSRSDSLFKARFVISVKAIKRLRGALERANFQTIETPVPNPGVCADCFQYSIDYRGHEVTFSDVTMPQGLRPVVDQIEAIIVRHLPFH